jgi:pantoate--beta-alanine ligase
MGALHAGHLAHIGRARAEVGRVIVSVFVNPTQFGPGEDLERYPRTLDVDVAKCETAGAAAVFAPEPETVYPPRVPAVSIDVPGVAGPLEGALRPGHFAGVCRVVLKLLNLIQPNVVTFGRKDYQQLCVVRAMLDDLMLPTRVLEVPTVREDDGLAMSSRNRYLGEDDRRHARGLSKALRLAHRLAADGEADPAVLEAAMHETMSAHRVSVDYAAVRQARTLAAVDRVAAGETVALVAGRVGGVRLIDNLMLDDEAE